MQENLVINYLLTSTSFHIPTYGKFILNQQIFTPDYSEKVVKIIVALFRSLIHGRVVLDLYIFQSDLLLNFVTEIGRDTIFCP